VLETVDLADYPLPLSPAGAVIPAKVTTAGGYGNAQVDAFSLKIAGYDGFVFVTPQYNWSIPGVLKVSLDHLLHEWAGKPAVIVSYGGRGGAKAAAHLREIWQGVRGGDAECLRGGTFKGKNPSPKEANTRVRLSIYINTPI
jgi:NAD(P)H-dependent FMN reductase